MDRITKGFITTERGKLKDISLIIRIVLGHSAIFNTDPLSVQMKSTALLFLRNTYYNLHVFLFLYFAFRL